jgi:hypothetical protein
MHPLGLSNVVRDERGPDGAVGELALDVGGREADDARVAVLEDAQEVRVAGVVDLGGEEELFAVEPVFGLFGAWCVGSVEAQGKEGVVEENHVCQELFVSEMIGWTGWFGLWGRGMLTLNVGEVETGPHDSASLEVEAAACSADGEEAGVDEGLELVRCGALVEVVACTDAELRADGAYYFSCIATFVAIETEGEVVIKFTVMMATLAKMHRAENR